MSTPNPTAPSSTTDGHLPLGSSRSEKNTSSLPKDPVFTEETSKGTVKSSQKAAVDENFGEQLHEAQEQLLELRHKQKELERHQSELEELRVRQEKFTKGRVEITEKINRCMTRLDRETYQARKRLEQLEHAKKSFNRHLDLIEGLTPEKWSRSQLRDELLKATSALEDAEQDHDEVIARLALGKPEDKSATGTASSSPLANGSFEAWLKAGFAFTLPLIVAALVYVVITTLLPGA
ncbi:hypothetical protein [Sulfuriroseicoccus oceanibius]|uniref:Transmembrane protein n=1 Tax=Sulfuriroseicoccus oceanibius TaxID=2707525 RepID=A0A6B3L710_9BACT|nr:hypothetical protein [Sulfuriroseicoccus oceanibius]QQL43848.1 hypothetical protein G3M56_008045 [Sulfuriroseicoccus oceanibius]